MTVGARVRVRGELWRITDVRAFDASELVSLTGTGSANFGIARSVIAPFDTITPLQQTRPHLRLVGGRRWRHACRRLLASQGPSDALRTGRQARIDLMPHQLEPAIAMVRGMGSRVLIADEVGLGKTIQAGLIAAELRARMAADRILVLTPAGLRDQWSAELRRRFDLDGALFDIAGARRRAAELPAGVNPWATVPIAVASFDYVKRPEVFRAVAACRWDLVIVDEAHGVSRGSDRYAAIGALCAGAAYVVLLTATPHNGDHEAFEALCAVGRRGDDDRLLFFRRSRRDVGVGPGRRIHSLRVKPTAAESRMHDRLDTVSRTLAGSASGQNA
jgi:SNF2 family DNA or RNA helicase